jgi:hypothetical protein
LCEELQKIIKKNVKNILCLFSVLIGLISCSDSKEKKGEEQTSKSVILSTDSLRIDLEENSNIILKEWFEYYITKDSGFSLKNFRLERIDTLSFIQGNVFGNFDENFDEVYSDFIVFNRTNDKYIDFDSYQWEVDKNKIVLFSPDQEINLIDINTKTVTRIGFRGPLQWVEDAFWENDSIIVLVENSADNSPIISKIHLKNKVEKTFRYNDSLEFKSKYPQTRFKKKGLKYDD